MYDFCLFLFERMKKGEGVRKKVCRFLREVNKERKKESGRRKEKNIKRYYFIRKEKVNG